MEQMKTLNFFDLSHSKAKTLLESSEYPWEVLPKIGDFILSLGATLPSNKYRKLAEDVWVSKTAKIYPNIYIEGPAIIGHNTEIRPGAFIRGKVLVGENCVIGNSTELKNVILFDNVQVPHFNYVGDSVLGYKAHTGAGAVTSNVKQDRSLVTVNFEGEKIPTGLKKFGAIIGDRAEIGCNAVLNPGAVIGRDARVYPLSMVRGFVPENCIYKKQGEITEIENQE